jgi:quinoprotein glucose dehydrogenase
MITEWAIARERFGRSSMKKLIVSAHLCASALAVADRANSQGASDWPFYGYDSGSTRFSPLRQITPANVSHLKLAWTYDMRPAGIPKPDNKVLEAQAQENWIRRQGVTIPAPGAPAAARGFGGPANTTPSSAEEFTPIVVDNTMFVATAFGRVVALDATTGKEKWTFHLPDNEPIVAGGSVRGLHYWPGDKDNKPRLVIVSIRLKLFTLDPQSGKINSTFGKDGILDLRTPDVMGNFPDGFLGGNAMPVMYQNIIIVGSRGQESPTDGPRGDIRGVDVITGKTLWKFNAIPEPGEPNFGTWQGDSWKNRAGVNTWNMITVDDKRGIAYLPFGAPAYDRNGATRIGDGLYGNALVAIDAKTGKYLWHFQTIHHDVWDDDIPGTPTLLDVKRGGKIIPAVAAINKTAILFILDRVTGKPLFDVVETPVPKGEVPGDITSPTQPIPVKPEQLAKASINLDTDISDITPEHEAWCKKWVADNHMVSTTRYSPLGFNKATVIFPGAGGGVNWGGGAFDKASGNYIVNVINQGSFEYMAMTPDGRLVMATSPNSWFADVRDGGMQCQKGPWGELVAVNVSTGDISWRSTLGVTDWLPKDKQLTGRPSTGGPIVTAGGLVFIAATDDKRFRAFDAKTGKQLWEAKLDASGHATPLTYLGKDGKQYVALIATGGSYIADPATSDNLVAYALP